MSENPYINQLLTLTIVKLLLNTYTNKNLIYFNQMVFLKRNWTILVPKCWHVVIFMNIESFILVKFSICQRSDGQVGAVFSLEFYQELTVHFSIP